MDVGNFASCPTSKSRKRKMQTLIDVGFPVMAFEESGLTGTAGTTMILDGRFGPGAFGTAAILDSAIDFPALPKSFLSTKECE